MWVWKVLSVLACDELVTRPGCTLTSSHQRVGKRDKMNEWMKEHRLPGAQQRLFHSFTPLTFAWVHSSKLFFCVLLWINGPPNFLGHLWNSAWHLWHCRKKKKIQLHQRPLQAHKCVKTHDVFSILPKKHSFSGHLSSTSCAVAMKQTRFLFLSEGEWFLPPPITPAVVHVLPGSSSYLLSASFLPKLILQQTCVSITSAHQRRLQGSTSQASTTISPTFC